MLTWTHLLTFGLNRHFVAFFCESTLATHTLSKASKQTSPAIYISFTIDIYIDSLRLYKKLFLGQPSGKQLAKRDS